MCGICGVVCFGDRLCDLNRAKAMCDVVAHRGPDDAGYFFSLKSSLSGKSQQEALCYTDHRFRAQHVDLPFIDTDDGKALFFKKPYDLFLGHRRLSILDTSTLGHQPMSNADQSVWITYNGEIYNFRELRTDLIRLGYVFHTETDTEVILAAYDAFGMSMLEKFNGMFAFALLDKRRQLLFLVRDRYGIKPLYYTASEAGDLFFGSEVKSILKYQTQSPSLDHEALLEYFTFQNIFTDKTLYQNIKLLPPGHYMTVLLNQRTLKTTLSLYWDFSFDEPAHVSLDDSAYIEELDRLFKQAVKRQLVSDVEVGSYLSGGLDSGSITAIAAQQIPYLKTFTVGFDLRSASGLELGFDERSKAEYLSYLFKTEHYEMVLKSGDMERCLPKFSWHLEEPRVGQSYPNFYASKLASKFVKVVLSGAGGDELFGGYPWRYYRAIANDNFEDYINKYYVFWQRLVDNKQLRRIFSPILDQLSHVWTLDIFKNVFRKPITQLTRPEDYVNHSLYFEAKTFLHGLLTVEDKLSMAHSLETRVPFLDNDLVEFAMKLPVRLKLGNIKQLARINENEFGDKSKKYFEKTNDGKLILRKVLNRYVPNDITDGIKQGFSSPDASWFKGESIAYVQEKLIHSSGKIYQWMDFESVKEIVLSHLNGKENKRLFIWSLLNFDAWCTQFLSS